MALLSLFFYFLICFNIVARNGDAGVFTLLTPLSLILALHLNFESRTSELTIIGLLLLCECGVMLARLGADPDTLTYKSNWLRDFRTTCLPVLHQREEHLFQLMDSRSEKQKQPKPTHTSRLTRFNFLVSV